MGSSPACKSDTPKAMQINHAEPFLQGQVRARSPSGQARGQRERRERPREGVAFWGCRFGSAKQPAAMDFLSSLASPECCWPAAKTSTTVWALARRRAKSEGGEKIRCRRFSASRRPCYLGVHWGLCSERVSLCRPVRLLTPVPALFALPIKQVRPFFRCRERKGAWFVRRFHRRLSPAVLRRWLLATTTCLR